MKEIKVHLAILAIAVTRLMGWIGLKEIRVHLTTLAIAVSIAITITRIFIIHTYVHRVRLADEPMNPIGARDIVPII